VVQRMAIIDTGKGIVRYYDDDETTDLKFTSQMRVYDQYRSKNVTNYD